jgi:hypothetical protein
MYICNFSINQQYKTCFIVFAKMSYYCSLRDLTRYCFDRACPANCVIWSHWKLILWAKSMESSLEGSVGFLNTAGNSSSRSFIFSDRGSWFFSFLARFSAFLQKVRLGNAKCDVLFFGQSLFVSFLGQQRFFAIGQ